MLQLLAFVALALLLATPVVRARRRTAALERKLDELRRRHERADAARQRLLSSLSHDLRSPLSAILGYQELIEDGVYGTVDDRAKDALGRIGHAARELLVLLDAVVEIARLEAGDEPLRPRQIRVDEILDGALDRLLELGHDGATIQHPPDGPAPTVYVDADRARSLVELAIAVTLHFVPANSIAVHVFRDGSRAIISFTAIASRPVGTADPQHERAYARSLRLDLATRMASLLGITLSHEPGPDGSCLRLSFPVSDFSH